MKNSLLLAFFLTVFALSLSGQKSILKNIDISFLVGYQVGGQGENRNFVTKSGLNLQVNALYELNNYIHAGIGLGFSNFKNETYIPIFVAAKARLKNVENCSYLKTQFGYSEATNNTINQTEFYDFDGGIYFSAGWGYQWSINEKLGLNFEINIEFQEAELEYESFSGVSFDDDIQNYFLSFKTGIAF